MQATSTNYPDLRSEVTVSCEGDLISSLCRVTPFSVKPIHRSQQYVASNLEVEEHSSSPEGVPSPGDAGALNAAPSVGILVATAIALIGFALFKSTSWKHVRDSVHLMKYSRQIPCSKCRFFHQNPYMRCAVHPTKAQTSRAINCSDYWGCDNDEFRH